jgi:hypothetical protein
MTRPRTPHAAHAPYHLHVRHQERVLHHQRAARMRHDVTSSRIGPARCHIVPVGSAHRGIGVVD